MTNQSLLPSISLECPDCGKHTIVEQPSGVFRCIACDFERNLSEDHGHSSRRSGRSSGRSGRSSGRSGRSRSSHSSHSHSRRAHSSSSYGSRSSSDGDRHRSDESEDEVNPLPLLLLGGILVALLI